MTVSVSVFKSSFSPWRKESPSSTRSPQCRVYDVVEQVGRNFDRSVQQRQRESRLMRVLEVHSAFAKGEGKMTLNNKGYTRLESFEV
jgi:hypothetical protein